MSYRVSTTKQRFEEFLKDPIFFCKYEEEIRYSINGMQNVGAGWCSCNHTINLFVSRSVLPENISGRKLFVLEYQDLPNNVIDDKKEDTDLIFFEVTEFDPGKKEHWELVFTDCAYNYQNGNREYCHMALFWTLYTLSWSVDVVWEALTSMSGDISQICLNQLCSNFFVLSLRKQRLLLNYLRSIHPQMTALIYSDIEGALRELSPMTNFDDYGLFQKVDYIVDYGLNQEETSHLNDLFETSQNRYIYLKSWLLRPTQGFTNYADLEEIHSFVNVPTQLAIAKRYLHDVRLHTVELDFNFIKTLRDVKYRGLFHVRNFIERPGDNIDLSSLLFCDILLTLKNSNGEKLQDFNGILDLAVTHSNPSYPNIDLGIRHFLPICDGGLKHNPRFIGFIHYSIVHDYDESLITNENLSKTVEFILNKSAELQSHYCCSCNNDEHLNEDIWKRCMTVIRKHRREVKYETDENGDKKEKVVLIPEKDKCPHLQYKPLSPFTWKILKGKEEYLNTCMDVKSVSEYFTQNDIDLKKLESQIRSWAEERVRYVLPNGYIPEKIAKDEIKSHYFATYFRPKYIILYPNNNVFYSSKKDLLGLWPDDGQTPWDVKDREAMAQKAESPNIFQMTFQALKNMYPNGIIGKDYVAIPYDESELRKVKDYFYYRTPFIKKDENTGFNGRKDDNQPSSLKFLFTPKLDKNKIIYCTPKLSDSKEKVSELPFFWCRSAECFCNVLDDQTLERQNDWHRYSLYHAAEIIGYKLIEITENGNIPDLMVSGFAAEVRQVERFYARLVCRTCGHMIFSTRGTILNGSRFFACLNPSCKQHNVEVYLSQCSNCKRGLIDSRDSKKCENGWIICPSCLSCCNDNLFNSLIAKHRRNGTVPAKLLANEGKGHNNKGIFFCPKCTSQLGMIDVQEKTYDEDGNEIIVNKQFFGCPQCKVNYEKELKLYKDHSS